MIGLGDTKEEIIETIDELRAHDVKTGQFLQPTKKHLKVQKYWSPQEFLEVREIAISKGFSHYELGPLVRSSYHDDEEVEAAG